MDCIDSFRGEKLAEASSKSQLVCAARGMKDSTESHQTMALPGNGRAFFICRPLLST